MSTSQTVTQITSIMGDIDKGVSELNTVKSLIAMEASKADMEFDGSQNFSAPIAKANTVIDNAISNLTQVKSSLQNVAGTLQ